MQLIVGKRIKGSGNGTKIGFPTFNFEFNELPNGVCLGLYASVCKYGKCLSLVSRYKDTYRIETNIIIHDSYTIEINVGDEVCLVFLERLRNSLIASDLRKMIKDDKKLVTEYFDNIKTCMHCQLCYTKDYGYSNYTVMESNIGCFANKFKEGDIYNFYLKYSSIGCELMSSGTSWELDVDGCEIGPSKEWISSTILSISRESKIVKILE
jgi:hypothetical protein